MEFQDDKAEDTLSLSGLSDPGHIAAPSHSSRVFQIDKKPLRRFYTVHSANDEQLFHVDISAFTPNKPDLTLHSGPTAESSVLAVCHFVKFSGDFKVGLGDPSHPDAVSWEDVTKLGLSASKYRWETSIPGATSGGKPRGLLWKRTRAVGVDDTKIPALSIRNHKLVDEETGELLAVFTSDYSLSKCGKMQLNVDYGEDFDRMVLITMLGLYDKARQRTHRGN